MQWLGKLLAIVMMVVATTAPAPAAALESIYKGKIEVVYDPTSRHQSTALANKILELMHATLAHFEDDIGFRSPVPSGQKYLVKVVDVIVWDGKEQNWGGAWFPSTNHIELPVQNNTYPLGKYGTIYHELFHAVQGEYGTMRHDWLVEASAVGIADHVLIHGVPANTARGTVDLPVINMPRPLEGADRVPGMKSPAQTRYFQNWQALDLFRFERGKSYQYDGGMFVHFLMHRAGPAPADGGQFLKQVWEAHPQDDSPDITIILSSVLGGEPELRRAMGDFGPTLMTGSLLPDPYTYPVPEVTIVRFLNSKSKVLGDVGGGQRYLGNYDPGTGEIVPRRVPIKSRQLLPLNLEELATDPAQSIADNPLLIGVLEATDIEVNVVHARTAAPEFAELLPRVGPDEGPHLYFMDDFRSPRDSVIVSGVNTTFDGMSERSLRIVAIAGTIPVIEEVVIRDASGDVYTSQWTESTGTRTQDTLELGIELPLGTTLPTTITLNFEVTTNVELAALRVSDETGPPQPGSGQMLSQDQSVADQFVYTGSVSFDIQAGQQSIAFTFEGADDIGHQLDGDPATVAQYIPWEDPTHWVNYEDHAGAGYAGGVDRNHAVTVFPAQGKLSVGQLHTCVINGEGLASCFGHNDFGQVGNVIGGSIAVPTTVLGLSDVVDVSAGFASSCAVQNDGLAFCWGSNEAGRLGDGTTTDSAVPVQVKGLTDIAEIDAGWARFSCARARGGQVYCWGDDTWSNLGTGTCDSLCQPGTDSWNQSTQAFADCNFCLINNHPQQHEAIPVTGLSDAQNIVVGEDHACAIRMGGQVVCWGNNTGGQLGARGPEPWRLLRSDAPQPVCLNWQEPGIGENLGQCLQTFDDAVEIYAADTMTCAIQAGGQLYCWGTQSAVVGLFGTDNGSPNPLLMSGLDDVTAATFYETLACAARSTGALDCWGFGAVGTGGYLTQLNSPTNIPEFDDARAVGVGKDHTCALNGGSLLCWGAYGGNSAASETPTLVTF